MLKFLKSYALAAMLAVTLVSFLVPRAAAQNDGKLEGTIIDFDGKPWADLPVHIKSDMGATQDGKTDANGKFAFTNLKPGKYSFSVKPPQMQNPFEVPVQVGAGGSTPPVNLNFKEILEKQNPEAAAKYKQQQDRKSVV